MIIATAGHVDHGKTRLVHALTGIDTDRLPDEKRRGMSIDLGFAYRDIGPGMSLGFVDVPGHERYIRNMLAGVVGVDAALLVVAADDGPMAQTREHLAVLDLLEITKGWVAITKTDRVDNERVSEVSANVAELIAGTSLANAPILPISVESGAGVTDLFDALCRHASTMVPHTSDAPFRLAIDRAFTVTGAGLVVTGYVHSGTVTPEDTIVVEPPGVTARVRGIHAQDQKAEVGRAGDRCAINIAGTSLRKEEIGRGGWLIAPDAYAPSRRLDATIMAPALGEPATIRHWTPAHVYLGAADVPCRIAPIGEPEGPRRRQLAQLVLDRSVVAKRGDRFILRDQSARQVVGGGSILDPFAPGRGRAAPHRHAVLEGLRSPETQTALRAVAEASPFGVDLDRFALGDNLPGGEILRLAKNCGLTTAPGASCVWGFTTDHWQQLSEAIATTIATWHQDNPSDLGPDHRALAKALGGRPDSDAIAAATRRLADESTLARRGTVSYLPTHRPQAPTEEVEQFAPIAALIEAGGRRPPRVREIVDRVDLTLPALNEVLQRASRRGWVFPVAENRYFGRAGLLALAKEIQGLAASSSNEGVEVTASREAFGIGRNLTIQVLEFFDSIGLTQRRGAQRIMLRSAEEIFGDDGERSLDHAPLVTEGNRTPVGRPDFKSGEAR